MIYFIKECLILKKNNEVAGRYCHKKADAANVLYYKRTSKIFAMNGKTLDCFSHLLYNRLTNYLVGQRVTLCICAYGSTNSQIRLNPDPPLDCQGSSFALQSWPVGSKNK